MSDTFANLSITSLCEISFIAGSYRELSFDVYNASGSPVNVSTLTFEWLLSPFGQPNSVSLSKTGVSRVGDGYSNRFTVYLYSTDTINLSGKYIQQPVIISNPGYEFRMGQGYVNIIPASIP